MKKILIFALAFAFCMSVNAASLCSYEEQTELNQKAANVRASYEVVTEKLDVKKEEGITEDAIQELFIISILNVTDDFYVKVKNNNTPDEMRYTSNDAKDGIITFKWDKKSSVTNFTFEVYTTDKTSCPNELYKTVYVTTPRYNDYYRRQICRENEEFYLCQKYVTFAEVSESSFMEQINRYIDGNVDKTGGEIEEPPATIIDKILNFSNDYKWAILGVVIVIVGGIGTMIIIKNKKQRDLGL